MNITVQNITPLFALILFTTNLNSQCPNIDFSQNNFGGWYGECTEYMSQGGTVFASGLPPFVGYNDRHQLFDAPVLDPNACLNIPSTPPHGGVAARLGNPDVGWMIDELEYTIDVSPENNLLLYHFAAILEEPDNCNGGGGGNGHSDVNRPKFRVEVQDFVTGATINGNCGVYEEFADPDSDNLRFCQNSCSYYRSWTTIGIDLRAYENLAPPNNRVVLKFRTEDCGQGGHFGYAYVQAECRKLDIRATFCENENSALLSAPDGFDYLWDNGETTQTIQLDNAVSGQVVSVDLITPQGCVSTISKTLQPVTVNGDYIASNLQVCLGESIDFSDISTAQNLATGTPEDITEWYWDFDNGTTSINQQESITFEDPGTYNVSLTVTAENGCTQTITKSIFVNPIPSIEIVVENKCPNTPLQLGVNIVFQGANIQSYEWDFDDPNSPNNSSNLQEPTHIYNTAGNYSPTLTATTDKGCNVVTSNNLVIFDPPQSNFEFENNCAGSNTLFTDLSTTPVGTVIESWSWNFDDNGQLFLSQNAYYSFSDTGIYEVSLITENNDGCVDTAIIDVLINGINTDFSFDEVCYNQVTNFVNTSDQSSIEWEWQTAGTTISNIENPSYLFPYPGFHEVTFTASTSEGCSDEISKFVYVKNNPSTNFQADIYEGCSELCVNFEDLTNSNNPIDNWTWFFDDKEVDTQNPNYCFTNAGYYDITLITTSEEGCSDTLKRDDFILVYPNVTADFGYLPNEVYSNNPLVDFENYSLGATKYQWNFDFLGSSSEENPQFNFPFDVSNTYEIRLVAANDSNCVDTAYKELKVIGVFQFDIPNTFTPNNDQLNDIFIPAISGADKENYQFSIFDRWGNIIFETQNLNEGWDGKIKEKDIKQDVYVWQVEVDERDADKSHVFNGHVTVLYPNALK